MSKRPAHSKYFSPSSLSRRIACPGSAFLEDGIENKSSDAADWGTYAHYIGERILKGKSKSAEGFKGREKFGQVCDQEMIDCVNQYLEDIKELTDPYVLQQVEVEVSYGAEGYPEMYGTADWVQSEIFGTLTVCDFKSGSGVNVIPDNNPQLMAYALMASNSMVASYEKIRLAISQPRAKTGGKSLKIWEITPQELVKWSNDTLHPVMHKILNGEQDLQAGEEQCQWCRATNICPAYSKMALEVAKVNFKVIEPTEPIINNELVSQVYPHLKLLSGWIKKVESHAFEMVSRNELDGYKLVNGRNKRVWMDEKEAAATIKATGGDPYITKILSPAQAEKLGKEIKTAIQEHIIKQTGNPVIAPSSDKRKALNLLENFNII